MKLILRNISNESIKSISFKEFEPFNIIVEELNELQEADTASLITANEKINSFELAKLKHTLSKLNINFIKLYSNNRETVLSGKSLKINSTLLSINRPKKEASLKGTVE